MKSIINNLNFKKLILIILLGVSSLSVFAQDVPNKGILYNTKETSSLVYDCSLGKDEKLRCDFIQTSVRKKTSKEELAKKLAQIPQQYQEAKASGFKNGMFNPPSAEECKMWRDMSEILSGKKLPPNGSEGVAALKTLSDIARTDLKVTSEALQATCDNHSAESYSNLVKIEGEKELKTCNASSTKYSQIFKRVKGSDGKEVWVVESLADGDCGAVRLDVFSAEVINNYSYWNYTARRVITNPKGKTMGLECSKFDQEEYLYSWKSRELVMECTYINFSPL